MRPTDQALAERLRNLQSKEALPTSEEQTTAAAAAELHRDLEESEFLPLAEQKALDELARQISYFEVKKPDSCVPLYDAPHLLVFHGDYFIALCVAVCASKEDHNSAITVSARYDDSTIQTWYCVEPAPTEQQHDRLSPMFESLFLHYEIKLQRNRLEKKGLVIPKNSPAVSDKLYAFVRSTVFNQFVSYDIKDQYESLLVNYEEAQREAETLKKQKAMDADLHLRTQFCSVLEALNIALEQQTDSRNVEDVCDALNPQLKKCTELFNQLLPRSKKDLQLQYGRAVEKVDELKKLALVESERKKPSQATLNAGKTPSAKKTAPAAKEVELPSTTVVEVRAASPARAGHMTKNDSAEKIRTLIGALRQRVDEVKSLNGALHAAKEKQAAAEAKAQQEIAAAAQRLQDALREKDEEIATVRKELEGVNASIHQMEEKNRVAQVARDALTEELKLMTAQCKKLEGELQQARTSAGRAKEAHQAEKEASRAVKATAAIKTAEVERLRECIAAITAELNQVKIERDIATRERHTLSAELEAAKDVAAHNFECGFVARRAEVEHLSAVLAATSSVVGQRDFEIVALKVEREQLIARINSMCAMASPVVVTPSSHGLFGAGAALSAKHPNDSSDEGIAVPQGLPRPPAFNWAADVSDAASTCPKK